MAAIFANVLIVVAHLAMETGATGGSGAPCNTCSEGAAEIMAIHSLRVILSSLMVAQTPTRSTSTPQPSSVLYTSGTYPQRRA